MAFLFPWLTGNKFPFVKKCNNLKGLLAYARDPSFGLLQNCNSQKDYAPFGRMILYFVRC